MAVRARPRRAVSLSLEDIPEAAQSTFHPTWAPAPEPYLRPMDDGPGGIFREVSPELEERTVDPPKATEEEAPVEYPDPVAPPPPPPRREAPLSLTAAKFLATSVCGFEGRGPVSAAVFVLCRVLCAASVHRGERLCDEGDPSDVFFVVLSGHLKEEGGGPIYAAGDFVGYDDFALVRSRPAAIVALDDASVAVLSRRHLDAIGCRDAHLLSQLLRACVSQGADLF